MQDAIVAAVETRPETVLDDYDRLLRLAGLADAAATDVSSPTLLLAPPGAGPTPAGDVAPWQVSGVMEALQAAGVAADDLAVRWPDGREPEPAIRGVVAAAGVDAGTTSGGIPAGALVLSGLATHRRLGVRGPLAAAVAALAPATPTARLVRNASLLATTVRAASPGTLRGAVVDATLCGDGPEPPAYEAVAAHVLLAGRDPVAVEVVAGRLLGLAPGAVASGAPLIRAAAAAGWGVGEADRIRVVGDLAAGLPQLTLCEVGRAGSGWLADDWPAALRRGWLTCRRLLPGHRARRRRYETLPWARLRRDWRTRGAGEGDTA